MLTYPYTRTHLMHAPYRHSPASRRNESRAPRPHSRTRGLSMSFFASSSVRSAGTEISNPSSPVYLAEVGDTWSANSAPAQALSCTRQSSLTVSQGQAALDGASAHP